MNKRHAIRFFFATLAVLGMLAAGGPVLGAEYRIDPRHSFVEFRIQHLGYSWLMGRFNTVSGEFSHDAANPTASTITVTIDTASVDTHLAERDKHLRSGDFLDVDQFPDATFESTGYTGSAESGTLEGKLTLHGVTRPIAIQVKKIGEGPDPWGGYRAGFWGVTKLTRKDFNMGYNLGPAGETMELELSIEGVRK
jgi:polyisoprenoid-binding protein YceI